jgi:hypothetical protein
MAPNMPGVRYKEKAENSIELAYQYWVVLLICPVC